MKQPAIYILASSRNGTLYIGATSNLVQRIWQHRRGVVEGFAETDNAQRFVYYELHADMRSAIEREKLLKKWNRLWTMRLIDSFNADWEELYRDL